MAGIVKDQAGQQMIEGCPGSGPVGPSLREGGLNSVEEGAIEDRRLVAEPKQLEFGLDRKSNIILSGYTCVGKNDG